MQQPKFKDAAFHLSYGLYSLLRSEMRDDMLRVDGLDSHIQVAQLGLVHLQVRLLMTGLGTVRRRGQHQGWAHKHEDPSSLAGQ